MTPTVNVSGPIMTEDEFNEYYTQKVASFAMKGFNFIYKDNLEYNDETLTGTVEAFTNLVLSNYIIANEIKEFTNPKIKVTIYHLGDTPTTEKIEGFDYKGGFETIEELEKAMTQDSDFDLIYIKPGQEDSNLARNILRRFTLPHK